MFGFVCILTIIKLNNYVVQLIRSSSVLSRRGSFTICLLLNDSSHDAHFATRQNMQPVDFLEKTSNFSLHGFFRYTNPNMALQKIILTSFFVFCFFRIEDIAMHSNIFIGVTSVLSRLGSFTIFLLLTDSSYETHFSTSQNMDPEDFLEKKSNFSLHGFSRYSTPNMALQKIIPTSFLFLLPVQGLCVLRAITSRRY